MQYCRTVLLSAVVDIRATFISSCKSSPSACGVPGFNNEGKEASDEWKEASKMPLGCILVCCQKLSDRRFLFLSGMVEVMKSF